MTIERTAIERRVHAALDAGRIPVLLGGCGSGRTSVLLRIAAAVGADRAQYLDLAACATTPERCLAAMVDARRGRAGASPASHVFSPTAKAAFDAVLDLLDEPAAAGVPLTFLIDEFLELRTFENFPGLRHVQRDALQRLARSGNRFVLTSRFTMRAHRLLRDAPARFEVMHVPALDARETDLLAKSFAGLAPEHAAAIATDVRGLTDGRPAYAAALFEHLAATRSHDAVGALAHLFAPNGRLTSLARFSYEFRLHRARGYGALKAILGVLAEHQPLNLTEIAQRLQRTPGSTKDYLSWLEDVDLLTVERKRYAFDDSLMRLYVRLYGLAVPPTPEDIRREAEAFAAQPAAAASVPSVAAPASAPATAASAASVPAQAPAITTPAPTAAPSERPGESGRSSGIIEID